ncbi:hypothetical protein I7I51_05189 [Histoplasma capsulatum]|uniref:Uncharacterized protein n=1 Tax=Ajellomyces capsulatus TaxID=5037 RepID=A0A8A1M316_AJECA|nr:predicted protein [Histoplasma mississippiense (nom. inval.)]EDN03952.1 predicted protein [Histoplasma mississippiense (nom. inval.)]QSS60391.1 hypothetical protein I7I51_05189 [Histoplasma capsulatum]
MRSALYFVTELLAAGSAVASAVPSTGDVGGEDLKVVNLTEDDLEPIPDGVCKNKNRTDCYKVSTRAGTCINLVSSNGKPFVSASSAGSCQCVAYSKRGCPIWSGDSYGFTVPTTFSFNANSIQCYIY